MNSRHNFPGFTDHTVEVVKDGRNPRAPFQVRWGYNWAGKHYTEIQYYARRPSATIRAAKVRELIAAPQKRFA